MLRLTHTQIKREKERKKKESDRERARDPGRDLYLDTRARKTAHKQHLCKVMAGGVLLNSVIEEGPVLHLEKGTPNRPTDLHLDSESVYEINQLPLCNSYSSEEE